MLPAEAVRGRVGRGLRALAGANLTFGVLLVCLVFGLSVAAPSGLVLRALEVGGGALLVWLAIDGFRSGSLISSHATPGRQRLPPAARGALAVLLNPGPWLFLGAVASPLFTTASQLGGVANALLTALALMVGVGLGDAGVWFWSAASASGSSSAARPAEAPILQTDLGGQTTFYDHVWLRSRAPGRQRS